MTRTIPTSTSATSASAGCDRTAAITRSLLGGGVLAGPVYLVAGLAQALTRDGFDITRHQLSLLANGDLGWIQITNLVLTGLMTVAGAVGVRRALRGRPAATWGPRLLGVYGAGLVGAGVFAADPTSGFPPGTPAGPATVSWHGLLHLACGAIGFLALITACFVIARRFAAARQRGWAAYSRITGVVFLAGFAGIASGSGSPATVSGFWVAVVLGWAWISALSVRLYREVSTDPRH